MKKFEQARDYTLKAVNALFDGLIEVAKLATAGTPAPTERGAPTPPTRAASEVVRPNGRPTVPPAPATDEQAPELKAAVADALRARRRRPPREQVHEISDRDREIVLVVHKGSTGPADWTQLSRRLQANLRLTGQQVAGIIAAETRRKLRINAAAAPN